jgi:hypothetical protein
VTDTWTAKASMPTARAYLSGSVVNGRIYAIDGRDSVNFTMSIIEGYTP